MSSVVEWHCLAGWFRLHRTDSGPKSTADWGGLGVCHCPRSQALNRGREVHHGVLTHYPTFYLALPSTQTQVFVRKTFYLLSNSGVFCWFVVSVKLNHASASERLLFWWSRRSWYVPEFGDILNWQPDYFPVFQSHTKITHNCSVEEYRNGQTECSDPEMETLGGTFWSDLWKHAMIQEQLPALGNTWTFKEWLQPENQAWCWNVTEGVISLVKSLARLSSQKCCCWCTQERTGGRRVLLPNPCILPPSEARKKWHSGNSTSSAGMHVLAGMLAQRFSPARRVPTVDFDFVNMDAKMLWCRHYLE